MTYSALGFRKGVISTFFNPKVIKQTAFDFQCNDLGLCHSPHFVVPVQTPLAIFDRIRTDGAKALKEILPKTKLWIPSKKDQVNTSITLINILKALAWRLRLYSMHARAIQNMMVCHPWGLVIHIFHAVICRVLNRGEH